MTKPLSFALVGAGGIAQSYAAAFDNCPDAELVAVADVRLDDRSSLLGGLDKLRRDIDRSGTFDGLDKFNRQAVVLLMRENARKAFAWSLVD